MSSYAIVVKGEFAYQQQAMLNMFRKGVEWQAKQFPWISVEDAIPNKQAEAYCDDCSLYGICHQSMLICHMLGGDIFVSRGKVTELKTEEEKK